MTIIQGLDWASPSSFVSTNALGRNGRKYLAGSARTRTPMCRKRRIAFVGFFKKKAIDLYGYLVKFYVSLEAPLDPSVERRPLLRYCILDLVI